MADWKEKIGNGIRGIAEKQQALLGATRQGCVVSADALQRSTAFQLGVVGEVVDTGAEQLRLLGEANTPKRYLEGEFDLLANGAGAVVGRARDLAGLYADGMTDLVTVLDRGLRSAKPAN